MIASTITGPNLRWLSIIGLNRLHLQSDAFLDKIQEMQYPRHFFLTHSADELFLWLSFSAPRERPVITVGGGDLFLPKETASHFSFFLFFPFKLSSTSNFNNFTSGMKILVVLDEFPAINLYCFFKSQHCTSYLKWGGGWCLLVFWMESQTSTEE